MSCLHNGLVVWCLHSVVEGQWYNGWTQAYPLCLGINATFCRLSYWHSFRCSGKSGKSQLFLPTTWMQIYNAVSSLWLWSHQSRCLEWKISNQCGSRLRVHILLVAKLVCKDKGISYHLVRLLYCWKTKCSGTTSHTFQASKTPLGACAELLSVWTEVKWRRDLSAAWACSECRCMEAHWFELLCCDSPTPVLAPYSGWL